MYYSVDPLAEEYPYIGSYVYCIQNPVKFIDPDGRDLKTANKSSTAATSIAKIVATGRGKTLFGSLQKSENLYTLQNSWSGVSSQFNDHDPSNNKIIYGSVSAIGAFFFADDSAADYPEEITMIHEATHAFDHANGVFTDSRTIPIELRRGLEQNAVSMENYLREVYSMSPMRTTYKGMGENNDPAFFGVPANGEQITDFKLLNENNDATQFGFSYQKNDQVNFIIVNFDTESNVTYQFYNSKETYENAIN